MQYSLPKCYKKAIASNTVHAISLSSVSSLSIVHLSIRTALFKHICDLSYIAFMTHISCLIMCLPTKEWLFEFQ